MTSTTTYVPFTVTMKRNAKTTKFTVTDERGIEVAAKRSASVGYPYFVVGVHFVAATGEVTVNVIKRTANPKAARSAKADWPHRAILCDAQPEAKAWIKVPVRSGDITFTTV